MFNVAHVFFECPFAVQVCSMAGLWQEIQVVVASSSSAIEAVFALLHSLSATLSQRLAAIF
jgi:hypothetical protein